MTDKSNSFKTINEIAKDLGVSKQRVYRFIKREGLHESYRDNGVMYYDDVAVKVINKGFKTISSNAEVPHDAHLDVRLDALTDALLKQVEIKDIQLSNKDIQIEELTKLLDQQQQLLLMTSKQKDQLEIDYKNELDSRKRKWFRR